MLAATCVVQNVRQRLGDEGPHVAKCCAFTFVHADKGKARIEGRIGFISERNIPVAKEMRVVFALIGASLIAIRTTKRTFEILLNALLGVFQAD
jgi:hypothetical protein